MNDVARVAQKNLERASGHRQYHYALIYIRFNFPIVFRKEKQGKKNRLHDSYEDENSKQIDFVNHELA
jgi:hypothetical protein